MVWMEIRENSILRIESADMVCHETRYFENYMTFFFSFFMNIWEDIRESSSEITTEIDRSLWKTGLKKVKQEPRGRGFTISTSDSMYLKSFWDVSWEEIQFRDNLVRFIDTMRRRETRRWDKMRKTLKRFGSIRLIAEDKIDLHCCTKSCQRLTDFSFTVNENSTRTHK